MLSKDQEQEAHRRCQAALALFDKKCAEHPITEVALVAKTDPLERRANDLLKAALEARGIAVEVVKAPDAESAAQHDVNGQRLGIKIAVSQAAQGPRGALGWTLLPTKREFVVVDKGEEKL